MVRNLVDIPNHVLTTRYFITNVKNKPLNMKEYAYQHHPIALIFKIHEQAIPAGIVSLDSLTLAVDYPNLTEFRVGECIFTLIDTEGEYSPNNPSNFFTRQGGDASGRNAPVEIEAGYWVDNTAHTETLYKGQIVMITYHAKSAQLRITCTDNFEQLRTATLTDYGIERHFRLIEGTTERGFYPILPAILPASIGSINVNSALNTQLTLVPELAEAGELDNTNYIIRDDGIQTEGDFTGSENVGYPQVQFKSPFRYKPITNTIDSLLTQAGITNRRIHIPKPDVAEHFASNGRVGYELIGTSDIGSSNPATWNGYVTDFLKSGNTWYFLYNGGKNNVNGITQVIAYNPTNDTYTRLHRLAAGTEAWKFLKNGNTLYILVNSNGVYDAAETADTKIVQVDISGTPTETDFVPSTATLQPQLAHRYIGVGKTAMKPDSRRSLHFFSNELYYAYHDATNNAFGVAKASNATTRESVVSINMDNRNNHVGIDFDITSGVLRGACTFNTDTETQIITFNKTL